jgi:hypothetical protein
VARVLKDREINLIFRKNFDNEESIEWEELEGELEEIQLNNE